MCVWGWWWWWWGGGGGGCMGVELFISEITESVHDYPVSLKNGMLISIAYHISFKYQDI